MGQIKNIKLHIVTDIKNRNISSSEGRKMVSVVKIAVLLLLVVVVSEARHCGFRWRGPCPPKRSAQGFRMRGQLPQDVEALRGNANDDVINDDTNDVIQRWKDEDVANHIQDELIDIIRKTKSSKRFASE